MKVIEDFVNDFINICHPKLEEHLIHLPHVLLYGIQKVFPPHSLTKYGIPDPILEAKLEKCEDL